MGSECPWWRRRRPRGDGIPATTKRLASGGCDGGDSWNRCLSVRAASANSGRRSTLRDRRLADPRVPRQGLEGTGAGVLETESERRRSARAAPVRRTDTERGVGVGESARLERCDGGESGPDGERGPAAGRPERTLPGPDAFRGRTVAGGGG